MTSSHRKQGFRNDKTEDFAWPMADGPQHGPGLAKQTKMTGGRGKVKVVGGKKLKGR